MKTNLWKRLGLAASAMVATVLIAAASGLWPGLPNAIGPGFPSPQGVATGGAQVPLTGCIPMDTGNAAGVNPATMCVSPSQLVASVLGSVVTYSTAALTAGVLLNTVGFDYVPPAAGTLVYAQINLPAITITTITCLNGSTGGGGDNILYALYSGQGALVGNTGQVAGSGNNAYQAINLTAPVAVPAGIYFLAKQTSGTTTRVRSIPAAAAGGLTGAIAGTFGTLPATIPVPTAFTPNVGPICYVT